MKTFRVEPIGVIRSELKKIESAPLFYTEGAPNAFLEIDPAYLDGLHRMQAGDEIIIITWLHRARRDVLQVHPRGNPANPLTGVFLTRSPDRPNPLGLHRTKVLEMHRDRLSIGPIEAIDGTPVIDISQWLNRAITNFQLMEPRMDANEEGGTGRYGVRRRRLRLICVPSR